MTQSPLNLLRSRRFLPLFTTQFLGAANDNVFKNALIMLILYRIAEEAAMSGQLLVTAAGGIFILPFFLFSALAGQLADKFEKSRLIRIIKFFEIVFMAMATAGLFLENAYYLLAVLFLMGTQSAFFGPLKYGILPDHLRENELLAGNAMIEAGTFLAILLGTIVGGLAILMDNGAAIISAILLMLAVLGFGASYFIPRAKAAAAGLRINPNIFSETWRIVRHAASLREVFPSILGISWFWLVGATFLTQFPNFAKIELGANEQVVTLFLTVFAVGIGVGSVLCNKMLKGEISAKHVPLGALGMTLFTVDLYFAGGGVTPSPALIGAVEFLAHPVNWAVNWRIVADLALIAVCGGVYTVPLYAILQNRSEASHRSRNIAANNILNALFMVTAAVATAIMLARDFSVSDVFLTIAVLNAAVAVYIRKLIPKGRRR